MQYIPVGNSRNPNMMSGCSNKKLDFSEFLKIYEFMCGDAGQGLG